MGKRVENWSLKNSIGLILGAIFAYFLVGILPVETPATLLAFFLSGAIAICAMILPGISGSFMLIIMGKYSQVLGAVTDRNIVVLLVFMLGAICGLAMFSRLLSWLFSHYHDLAMAVLTGVMLGSLRKLWPWKEVLQTYTDSHGAVLPLVERNIMPTVINVQVLTAIALMVIGVILITLMSRYDQEK